MNRVDIINRLIEKYNYKSYLEIGFGKGVTFNRITCTEKTAVDIKNTEQVTYNMNSDAFFTVNNSTFDIIFIDGLHTADQVKKNILNALYCLNTNGSIVCHDVSPQSKQMQVVPKKQDLWTGDVWKTWVLLRQTRDDLNMRVIDADYGVGIIQRGSQKIIPFIYELTYEELDKNREKWLNIINENEL